MKKVIVTGANGFIGAALLRELSKREIRVVAVVRDKHSKISNIQNIPNVSVVYCSMDEMSKLPSCVEERDFDACFHLAWEGSFGPARADYEIQLRNVQYTLDMIAVAHQLGVKRFVGVGTLAEKDVDIYLSSDGAAPAPISIYGIAKLTAHYMTKTQCTKYAMEYIWCSLSNTYGIGNTTNNFVNMASNKMLNGERAAFTAGEQMYDFLYITDAAKALADAAMYGKSGTDYFLGSTKPQQLKTYIRQIRDAIDPDIPLYLGEIPFRGVSLPPEELSTKKLEADTPFVAEVSFEDGIRRTIEWLKQMKCK